MINNFLLDVLAAGAILSGILVITSKNPVIAVLFLISAFVNSAGYLILLGVGFVGISYIIVYVGAIAVLFLFVIMMINIKLADILDVGSQYTKNLPLAFTVGSLFVFELFSIIPVNYQNVHILNLPLDLLNYLNGLFYGSSTTSIEPVNLAQNPHVADSVFTNFTQIESLGHGLYTYGAVTFLICSMILLLSMLAPISVVHSKSVNNQQSVQNHNPSPRAKSLKGSLQFNLLNRASYHTSSSSVNNPLTLNKNSNSKLNPLTVTGITDAEGWFGFTIHRRKDRKLGFEIRPRISFHMHAREYPLLVQMREFFGVGNVYCIGISSFFVVSSREDIATLINHFELYPLLTSKLHSFNIFKIVFGMFCSKEHLSKEGFMKAVSYINCLNKPIEDETLGLINSIHGPLPELVLPPVVKHSIIDIKSPWWVVGFIAGEGCFSYRQVPSKVNGKLFIYFSMSVSQTISDKYILDSIANYFGVGRVYLKSGVAQLEINNIKGIQHIVLPFFQIYPLLGHKRTQFEIWLEAITITLCTPVYSKERETKLLELVNSLSNLSGNMHKK